MGCLDFARQCCHPVRIDSIELTDFGITLDFFKVQIEFRRALVPRKSTNSDRNYLSRWSKWRYIFSEHKIRSSDWQGVSPKQILEFDGNGPPFMKRRERRGKCRIRRLDGSSRIVEYTLTINYTPHRHLSRFHDVTPGKMECIAKFDPRHDIERRVRH
jgi:hypothetical protein